ncbi:MAG: exopolysaccharide biosynthesis protein [Pseudomonadota bacterium]
MADDGLPRDLADTERVDGPGANTASAPKGAIVTLRSILSRSVDASGPEKDPQLGDIVDQLDERAFGFILLLLALPCCLPFVYILPQIVALPMLALAGQLAIGKRHPWLPNKFRTRTVNAGAFASVLDRAEKYVGWVEAIAQPRVTFLTGHLGARLFGALLLIPCASILVPVPATNTVPGIGVAIASLGLIERDGVLTVLGVGIGLLWVALLLIVGVEAASIIKDWIAARL